MDLRVGWVAELLRHHRAGRGGDDLLGLGDGALHALGPLGEHKLRAEEAQHLAPLDRHGLGHGDGLEIHELPYVNARSKYTLSKNMVITIEPGVYFAGKFGLRIEDTVIVREDSVENLINLPHEIIVV